MRRGAPLRYSRGRGNPPKGTLHHVGGALALRFMGGRLPSEIASRKQGTESLRAGGLLLLRSGPGCPAHGPMAAAGLGFAKIMCLTRLIRLHGRVKMWYGRSHADRAADST